MARCKQHKWEVLFPATEDGKGDLSVLENGDGTYDYCIHCGAIGWVTRHASRNRVTLKWPEIYYPTMDRARQWNSSLGRPLPTAFERETVLLK